jgi:hypothetical protein
MPTVSAIFREPAGSVQRLGMPSLAPAGGRAKKSVGRAWVKIVKELSKPCHFWWGRRGDFLSERPRDEQKLPQELK